MLKQVFNRIAIVTLLVAGAAHAQGVASLEMRGEAAIIGDAVKLKQIARWSEADGAFFRDLGEMTVVRFEPEQREMTINLDTVRTMLQGAGVNEGAISMRGPTAVTVRRLDADAPYAKVVRPEQPKDLAGFLAQSPATRPAAVKPAEEIDVVLPQVHEEVTSSLSLRNALTQYLADRINLPAEDLELTFPATFDKVLGLSGPAYTWRITTYRSARLGPVNFKVTLTNGASVRQVEISCVARAWQKQLRVARPVPAGATLRTPDLEYKRMLVDSTLDQTPVRLEFALSMQTKRDLRPGELLTMSVLNPVLMVKKGQYVSMIAKVGSIEMKSVGIARDDGAYGAPVRVEVGEGKQKRDVVVTMTAPQEGRAGGPETITASGLASGVVAGDVVAKAD